MSIERVAISPTAEDEGYDQTQQREAGDESRRLPMAEPEAHAQVLTGAVATVRKAPSVVAQISSMKNSR